jgi:hypothetical protein
VGQQAAGDYLRDLINAQDQLKGREKALQRYLKGNKTARLAYDAFIANGGGTLGELERWVASYKPLPSLAQKRPYPTCA